MNIIAAISGNTLVWVIVQIFAAALIFWLVNWFVGYVGIGEPFNKVIKVVLGLIVLIFLINAILTLAGRPFINF